MRQTGLVKDLGLRLLNNWVDEPEVTGATLILIVCPQNLEVDVSSVGVTPTLSPEDLKSYLMMGAATLEKSRVCENDGVCYPLRLESELLGVCVLFPAPGALVREHWSVLMEQYESQAGPLLLQDLQKPPTLNSLAEVIPTRTHDADSESSSRLHWEKSQTRVDVPVHEELADHLILDNLPLF